MTRLLLLRHGKSDHPPGVADRDRPVADRGRKQSEYAGRACRERKLTPDLALISPTRRTRDTWQAYAAGLGLALESAPGSAPEAVEDERIYDNTVDDLLDLVHETAAEVQTLLLVGHNPGVHALALLLNDNTGAAAESVADGYPTGMLAVFEVDVPWPELDAADGRLVEAIRGI